MKNDTKLSLVAIIWIPFAFVGMVAAMIAWGFMVGFDLYNEMEKWFADSEIMKK